jgi:hypothetical protein
MAAGMSRDRYAAGLVGAIVALGLAFALIPGSMTPFIALGSAAVAIAVERFAFT